MATLQARVAITRSSLPGVLTRAREAQSRWSAISVRARLRAIAKFRAAVAERADRFAASVPRRAAQTLTAEVLPLAEACRFLEHHAADLLAPRRVRSYRPLWMRSVDIVTRREPFGVILLIAPSNYPIFLPGVQMVQAVTAGNAVLLKPGAGGTAAAELLTECALQSGMPSNLVVLLDESRETAGAAISAGVDKVVITGSKDTGRAVLTSLGDRVIPAVAELSGWDPVFVFEDADINTVVAAVRFGVELNCGNTCIRPRVIYGSTQTIAQLRAALADVADGLEFVTVAAEHEALQRAARSEYALGATVFGSASRAAGFAERVRAGVVVINDMIVPTAHPAVPFGGRGASGFGVTRGAEGLLELTTLKTIVTRRSRWLPHLQPAQPGDARLFSAFIRALHGQGLKNRIRAFGDLLQAGRNRGKEN
jgi:acyl-CoA reductase-like NAD-dependent aldehyde dehydrogenase